MRQDRRPSVLHVLLHSLGAVACATAIAGIAFRDRLFSLSVDLGTHLSLVRAFRDHLFLTRGENSILGEMTNYPNFAHRIAAVLWKLGVDPINAVNLTGISAALTTWIILSALVAKTTRLGFILFIATSVLLTLGMNRTFFVGGEILLNFFFAQVVGDSALIVCAVLGWAVLRRHGVLPFLSFALLSVFLLAQFHLLPALRMALFAALLLSVTAFESFFAKRMREGLIAITGVILAPLSFVLNPGYRFMSKVAENDGSLAFGMDFSAIGVLELAGIVLTVSAFAFSISLLELRGVPPEQPDPSARVSPARWTDSVSIIYVIAAATAAGAIAQVFELKMAHAGSLYAVRKHLFGLTTFGLAALACLIGGYLDRLLSASSQRRTFGIVEAALISGLAMGAALFQRASALDVPHLIQVSKTVQKIENHLSSKEGAWPIFLSTSYPIPVNYFETVAILFSPQIPSPNAFNLLLGKPITGWAKISYIMTLESDSSYDVAACRKGPPLNGVVAVDASCFVSSSPLMKRLQLGNELTFIAGGSGIWSLTSGWWTPESWGTWSIGPKATIEVPVAEAIPDGDLDVQIDVNGFVVPSSPTRNVSVSVNGGSEVALSLTIASPSQTLHLPINGADLKSAGKLQINFAIANPESPQNLGLAPDARLMGVGVKKLRLLIKPS